MATSARATEAVTKSTVVVAAGVAAAAGVREALGFLLWKPAQNSKQHVVDSGNAFSLLHPP